MKNNLLKKKFITLRIEGISLRKSAEILGISRNIAYIWDKKFRSRIIDATKKDFDDPKEKLEISQKHRLEFLAEQFSKVKKEISHTHNLLQHYDDLVKVAVLILREIDKVGRKSIPIIDLPDDDSCEENSDLNSENKNGTIL